MSKHDTSDFPVLDELTLVLQVKQGRVPRCADAEVTARDLDLNDVPSLRPNVRGHDTYVRATTANTEK